MTSPIKRLLSGAGYSCAALLVGIGFGLVLTPYLVSSLGIKSYGVFTLASLVSGWCGILDFGLTTTTSRYITRYFSKEDWSSANETGSTAIVLFGGIAGLIFLLACGAYAAAYFMGEAFDETGILGVALFFSGVSFAISKISDGFLGVIKGSLRHDLTGGATLIFRIVYGLMNFGILFFGGRVTALCVGNSVWTGIQLLVYIALARRAAPYFHFSFRSFRRSRVRSLFSYSFFAFLAQAGETAVNRSDLAIIAALFSWSDVGSYNLVVVTLISYFNSFTSEASSWETNWFSRLAALERTEEDEREELEARKEAAATDRRFRLVGRALQPGRFSEDFYKSRDAVHRASIYASVFLAFEMLTLGRSFITRWVGSEYLSAFPALVVCATSLGLYRGVAETNARMLQGVARHRILAYGAMLHGALNVVLSILFARLGLGLVGIALGTALPGFVIHYLWIPNAACRLVGEPRSAYWRRTLKTTALACAATIAPGWCVLRWSAPSYPRIACLAVFSALLYFATVLAFGTSRSERARLVDLFRARTRARE